LPNSSVPSWQKLEETSNLEKLSITWAIYDKHKASITLNGKNLKPFM
jgi:hypothetical protein